MYTLVFYPHAYTIHTCTHTHTHTHTQCTCSHAHNPHAHTHTMHVLTRTHTQHVHTHTHTHTHTHIHHEHQQGIARSLWHMQRSFTHATTSMPSPSWTPTLTRTTTASLWSPSPSTHCSRGWNCRSVNGGHSLLSISVCFKIRRHIKC